MNRWTPFIILTIFIFLFAPIGSYLRYFVISMVGRENTALLFALFVILGAWILLRLMKRAGISDADYYATVILGAVLLGAIYVLRSNPEEAFHFLEYGMLGVFAFRALKSDPGRAKDHLLAALCVALVGLVEECLQGVLPTRIFDLRDIRFNATAGAIVQLVLFLSSTGPKWKS